MNRLTARERVLICLVLGVLFVVGNLSLWKALAGRHAQTQAGLVARRSEVRAMKQLLGESDQWAAREAWMEASQPRLSNPEQAGVLLLEELKEAARASDMLLENPELGVVEARPYCRSVSVQIGTKSSWEGLVKFLHAVQQPGRFLVFESATIQSDPADAKRMACRFKIAKWYALGARP